MRVFDDLDHYREHFSRLVYLERSEEQEAHEQEMRSLSGPERERLGRCVLGLRPSDKGPWFGGRRLVILWRQDIPDNEIGPGDMVLVSRAHPLRDGVSGVVMERTRHTFTVVLDGSLSKAWKKVRLDLHINDISFQRMLSALRNVEAGAFPVDFLLGKTKPKIATVRTGQSPALNPSQAEALSLALGTEPMFLIHGPFGTGKTHVLCELVVRALERGLRVLACGDSNAATDNLLEGMIGRGLEPVRVGHPARVSPRLLARSLDLLVEAHPDYQRCRELWEKMDGIAEQQKAFPRPTPAERRGYTYDEILRLGKHYKSGRGISRERIRAMARWVALEKKRAEARDEAIALQRSITQEILSLAQVICSTCSGAGSEFLEAETFDLVVIDEATQSTEPSCLVPLIKAPRAVLAGDHRQLPPTLLSRKAQKGGLGFTLFERMISLHPEASRLLEVQYRMHPDIMEFPNRAFYGGRLRAAEGLDGMRLSEVLEFKPKSRVLDDRPVVFVDTQGAFREKQRRRSVSRENPGEARVVKALVQELLASGADPSQIGVIAPYDDQVSLLRKLLPEGVEVKTVDGFQGREKEVIILSLVRSNPTGRIGFLNDRRRLNVAITRAQRKLVVVGDGATLSQDRLYRDFVEFLRAKGAAEIF